MLKFYVVKVNNTYVNIDFMYFIGFMLQ